jgi:hypothetical protein
MLLSRTDAVAHITADSPEAAALLQRERAELARAFEQRGFAHVEVHVDAHASGHRRDTDPSADDASGGAAGEDEPSFAIASRPAGRVDLFV